MALDFNQSVDLLIENPYGEPPACVEDLRRKVLSRLGGVSTRMNLEEILHSVSPLPQN